MATSPEERRARDAADKALATRLWADGIHVGAGQLPGDPLPTPQQIALIEAAAKARYDFYKAGSK